MLCTFYLCAALLFGVSRESEPPNGIWWQAEQPHSFQKFNASFGLALTSRQQDWTSWSLSFERMGKMSSYAVACGGNEPDCSSGRVPYSHWYGSERPHGVWAAWEPRIGRLFPGFPILHPLFAQVGFGAVWADFRMSVPDYTTAGLAPRTVDLTVGNNRALLSPLAGVGYRTRYVDAIFNWRLVRTVNQDTCTCSLTEGDFQGLGWQVLNFSLRSRF